VSSPPRRTASVLIQKSKNKRTRERGWLTTARVYSVQLITKFLSPAVKRGREDEGSDLPASSERAGQREKTARKGGVSERRIDQAPTLLDRWLSRKNDLCDLEVRPS